MFVVFDYDGVIIDSIPAVRRAVIDLHTFAGLAPPTDTEVHAWLGPSMGKSVTRTIAAHGLDSNAAQRLMDRYFESYVAAASIETGVFDEVVEIIDELTGNNVPIALATMKAHTEMKAMPAPMPGIDRFDIVEAPEHHGGGWTKTQLVAQAVHRLAAGGATGQGWMVGDRASDIEAGHVNGLTTIGVAWGSSVVTELTDAGADYLARSPAELLKTLRDTGYNR